MKLLPQFPFLDPPDDFVTKFLSLFWDQIIVNVTCIYNCMIHVA